MLTPPGLFRRRVPDYLDPAAVIGSSASCDVKIYTNDGSHVNFPGLLLAAISPILKAVFSDRRLENEDVVPCILTELTQGELTDILRFAMTGCLPEELSTESVNNFTSLGISVKDLPWTRDACPPLQLPEFFRYGENIVTEPKIELFEREAHDDFYGAFDDDLFESPAKKQRRSAKRKKLDGDVPGVQVKEEYDFDLDEVLDGSDCELDDSMDKDDLQVVGKKKRKKRAKNVEDEGPEAAENRLIVDKRLKELKAMGVMFVTKTLLNTGKLKPCDLIPPWMESDADRPELGIKERNKGQNECKVCNYKHTNPVIFEQHVLRHTVEGLSPEHFFCLYPDCREKLNSEKEFNSHVEEVHSGRKFPCGICGKAFVTRALLKSHVCKDGAQVYVETKANVGDTGKKDFECDHCGVKFSSIVGLRKHRKVESTHHCNNICPYSECEYKFASYSEHVAHINASHNGVKLYVCGICPETFRTKFAKLAHRKQTHVDDPAIRGRYVHCDICGKMVSKLVDHKAMYHDVDAPGWCNFCKENVEKKIQHMYHNHYRPDPKIPCTTCGAFVRKTAFDDHICELNRSNLKDGDMATKQCLLCGITFETMKELVDHMRGEHNRIMTTDRTYMCNECDFKSNTKAGLKEHKLVHLSDEVKAQRTCPHCHKSFFGLKEMKTHVRNAHIVPFHCNNCGIRFAAQEELAAHSCVKRQREMVQCDHCPKMFMKHRLMQHYYDAHAEDKEKPFQCQYCSKGFGTRKNWSHHENTHTNSKPFKCAFCDYACNSKGMKQTHEIRVHGRKRVHQPKNE